MLHHLDWICIVSLTSQPSSALWLDHFVLLVKILQGPIVPHCYRAKYKCISMTNAPGNRALAFLLLHNPATRTHVTPRTQHCPWRVYSFVLSTLPLLETSHSFFKSPLRATSTVKLPAPAHRQTLGLLLQSFFYSFCFRVLYIIDVYNSVSPNKLQAPLRQGLFPWYLKSLAHCKHSILN